MKSDILDNYEMCLRKYEIYLTDLADIMGKHGKIQPNGCNTLIIKISDSAETCDCAASVIQ